MDTNEQLREFMQELQKITPPYGDIVNNGIPGAGQSNIAAERVQALHRLAVNFAKTYQTPAFGIEAVNERAEEVEKAINVVCSIGAISVEQANKLIEDLLQLLNLREEKAAPSEG